MLKIISISLILTVFNVYNALSQQNNPLINAGKIIEAANVLCDSGKYTQATDTLKYISKSDTAYIQALTELTYTYFLDKKYNEAIQTANLALSFPSNFKHRLTLIKGNAFDNMGNADSAINVYTSALKKYPYSYLLYYNLGISYMNKKKYDMAIQAFQNSIVRNPLHASSHLALGRILGLMGQYTHAMLSLETYLIIEPQSNRSNNNLVFLNDLVNNNLSNEIEKIEPCVENTAFNDLDLLLKSGIAMKDAYKPKIKFNAPVSKQTQLLFESLEYKPNTGDFWMEMYVPIFLAIKKSGHFENFSYTLLASTSDKNVASTLSKNKNSLKEMNSLLYNELINMCKNQTIVENGKERRVNFYLDDNNYLVAIGNKTEDEKTRQGYWYFLYPNGEPKAEGNYDKDGNLDGKWLNYEDDGSLSLVENYKNGKLHGDYIGYFVSGKKRYIAKYTEGDINADVPYYYDCDSVKSSVIRFEKGIRNGKGTSYYKNGNILETYYYSNDSLSGENKCYYPQGSLKWVQHYKNDKYNGKAVYYYRNGLTKTECNFINGEMDGLYKTYFKNSKLFKTGNYTNGLKTGEWKEFNNSGVLVEIENYNDKGELHGESKGFDDDGILHYTSKFNNGKEKELTYYDKSGKILATIKPGEKNAKAVGYFPDGSLQFTGNYNDGLLDGTWTIYSKSGKIETIKNYKNGLLDGKYQNFYTSGILNIECTYKEGEMDGYYKKYFPNGKVNMEGWYSEGSQEGKWLYWNPDGALKETSYFLNDNLHGYSDSYAPDNMMQYSTQYKNGKVVSMLSYDNKGNVINNITFDGSKDYTLYYFDKKIRANADFSCNSMNKTYTFYSHEGNILSVYNYLNDNKDGIYKSYYPSGILKQEGYFEEGNKNGLWKYYDQKGLIESKGKYSNNEKDSIWTGFYPDGKIQYTSKYNEGTPIDTSYFYDSFGEFMYSLIYDKYGLISYQYATPQGLVSKNINLKDTGTITAYYKNGNISGKLSYKYGELFGKQILYYSNGNTYKDYTIIDGEYDGPFTEYYPNGKLYYIENMLMGNYYGTCTYYRPDGSLERIEELNNDNDHGTHTYYDQQGKIIRTEKYWNSIRFE